MPPAKRGCPSPGLSPLAPSCCYWSKSCCWLFCRGPCCGRRPPEAPRFGNPVKGLISPCCGRSPPAIPRFGYPVKGLFNPCCPRPIGWLGSPVKGLMPPAKRGCPSPGLSPLAPSCCYWGKSCCRGFCGRPCCGRRLPGIPRFGNPVKGLFNPCCPRPIGWLGSPVMGLMPPAKRGCPSPGLSPLAPSCCYWG